MCFASGLISELLGGHCWWRRGRRSQSFIVKPDTTQAENNQSRHMTKQASYMHLKYVQTERFLLPLLLLLHPFLLQTDNCNQIKHDTDEWQRDANVLLLLAEAEQEHESSRTTAVEKIWLMKHSAHA